MALGETVNTVTSTFCEVKWNELPMLEPVFQRYFDDVKYPGTFRMDALTNMWGPLIAHGNGVLLVDLTHKGDVQGLAAASFFTDQFNGEKTAVLTMWYVIPEARGNGIGLTLHDAIEQISKDRGCTALVHGHMTTVNKDGGKRLLESLGYQLLELGFRKAL